MARPKIGDDGKVAVWDVKKEKYVRMWPIDARECMNAHPKAFASRRPGADADPTPDDNKDNGGTTVNPHRVEMFMNFNKAQLTEMATHNDIALRAGGKEKTRSALANDLAASEFTPVGWNADGTKNDDAGE